MKNENYQIPKVFINRYVNQLSPGAFCVLTRFYRFYLDNEGSRELTISFSDFDREILFFETNEKNIWAELKWWDLVKRIYKENIYELNVTKIREDNKDFLRDDDSEIKKKKFRLKIKGRRIKKGQKKIPAYYSYPLQELVDFLQKLS